jgi:hypothetical protein
VRKTVWKFPLIVDDWQIVEMPANSQILCVQVQYEMPVLWALVHPGNPKEKRRILMAGTGHEREDLAGLVNYIGTFQLVRGQLVFHVFEAVLDAELAPSSDLVEAVEAGGLGI